MAYQTKAVIAVQISSRIACARSMYFIVKSPGHKFSPQDASWPSFLSDATSIHFSVFATEHLPRTDIDRLEKLAQFGTIKDGPMRPKLFAAAVQAFGDICVFLADSTRTLQLDLTFDYYVKTTEEGDTLLNCLRHFRRLRNLSLDCPTLCGTLDLDSIFHPMQAAIAKDLVSSANDPLHFLGLPRELQSSVLEYLVVQERPISLPNRGTIGPYHSNGTFKCCGQCQPTVINSCPSRICHCRSFRSYSTSCACVNLTDGVFFASTSLRAESLRLYWSKNIFIVPLLERSLRPAPIMADLTWRLREVRNFLTLAPRYVRANLRQLHVHIEDQRVSEALPIIRAFIRYSLERQIITDTLQGYPLPSTELTLCLNAIRRSPTFASVRMEAGAMAILIKPCESCVPYVEQVRSDHWWTSTTK